MPANTATALVDNLDEDDQLIIGGTRYTIVHAVNQFGVRRFALRSDLGNVWIVRVVLGELVRVPPAAGGLDCLADRAGADLDPDPIEQGCEGCNAPAGEECSPFCLSTVADD